MWWLVLITPTGAMGEWIRQMVNEIEMSGSNPYEPSRHGGSADSIVNSKKVSVVSHVLGVAALVWGGLAWAEWILVSILYPADGSPVPHLMLAPRFLLFILGCAAIVICGPLWTLMFRRWWMLGYMLPAGAYLVYQIARFF